MGRLFSNPWSPTPFPRFESLLLKNPWLCTSDSYYGFNVCSLHFPLSYSVRNTQFPWICIFFFTFFIENFLNKIHQKCAPDRSISISKMQKLPRVGGGTPPPPLPHKGTILTSAQVQKMTAKMSGKKSCGLRLRAVWPNWAEEPPLRFSWMKGLGMALFLPYILQNFWDFDFNTCSYGQLFTGVSPIHTLPSCRLFDDTETWKS